MKNVLVVDDSAETRSLLELVLQIHGYLPVMASSGKEAISLLQNAKIDLIISDLEMDNGDGRWLLGEMKAINEAPKIIIISGDISANEEQLKVAGAVAFFRKPFLLREFMNYVNSVF